VIQTRGNGETRHAAQRPLAHVRTFPETISDRQRFSAASDSQTNDCGSEALFGSHPATSDAGAAATDGGTIFGIDDVGGLGGV